MFSSAAAAGKAALQVRQLLGVAPTEVYGSSRNRRRGVVPGLSATHGTQNGGLILPRESPLWSPAPKMLLPLMVVTVCLPALMGSALTSIVVGKRAQPQHAVFSTQPFFVSRHVVVQRGDAYAGIHIKTVLQFLRGALTISSYYAMVGS